jgi:hypothetical protein
MVGFSGFDRLQYPGDSVMAWLRQNTNLVWCGYYLAPAPSQQNASWMGQQAALAAGGWGIAPIYVGQQVAGPGSKNSSAAQGTIDGGQAATLMTGEGFAPGSCVYLDLENGPPMPQAQSDYAGAWCDAVQAGGFTPGIYCSYLLASQANALRPDARIWAFRVKTTQAHTVPGSEFPGPAPSGCGFAGATAWQFEQNANIAVPPAPSGKLNVDLDSATSADPGAP